MSGGVVEADPRINCESVLVCSTRARPPVHNRLRRRCGQIRAATTTLDSTCNANNAGYEWGGAFATPANAYKWVAQAAVDGEYADPSMKLVVFDVHEADKEHLLDLAETAKTLIAGTCPVKNTGDSIPAPTAAGACYTLTFPNANPSTTDFHATVTTTGVANVAFFAAYAPTEFERDSTTSWTTA